LAGQSARVDSAAINGAPAHVDCSDLVECGRDIWVLRVSRTNAPEAADLVSAANVEVAVAGHIECSPVSTVGNVDRSLPDGPAIGGTAEFSGIASEEAGPKLVLEAVTHAGRGFIDSKPFLVAAVRAAIGRPLCPRLSAICGAPNVAAIPDHMQAEIEKVPRFIVVQHRVAAEDAGLQGAGEMPVDASVGGISIARLPEVRGPGVKLSPANRHLVAVCRVN